MVTESGDHFRWSGGVTLLLTIAAVALIEAVQEARRAARDYPSSQDEPDSGDERRAMVWLPRIWHKPAATRKSHNQSPNPTAAANEQVTGLIQHALLTAGSSWVRSQTGWTANLQGFRIWAPEGWPLCNAVRQRWTYGAAFVRAVTVSDASWAARLQMQ
jgi:hypothetical protein